MKGEAPFLSVVVPVHNEEETVERNFKHIVAFLRKSKWTFEIVAVNDGSTDGTGRLLEKTSSQIPEMVVVSYPQNAGKGNALQKGISATQGKWVLTLDADLELPVELLNSFFEAQRRTGAQVVIGSKWHPDSKVEYPSTRKFLSKGLHLLVRMLFPLNVTDSQVGIKLIEGDSARFMNRITLVKRFAWDIEFLLAARVAHLKISEAPITLRFGREGIGRVRMKSILQICRELAGTWYRHYLQNYYSGVLIPRISDSQSPGTSPSVVWNRGTN
jgi:glycosyltransferase involved in cell wall biosynthesis